MDGQFFDGTEAEDLFGGGEGTEDYGIGEDYYGEAPEAPYPSAYYANLARARAQERARAQARARYGPRPVPMPGRRPTYYPATSSGPASTTQVRQGFGRVGTDIQRTQAAVRNVDLDNKVQADTFGRALRAQRDRIDRNEYAQAASKVVDELKARFPDLFENEVLKTAIPLAPLLFLKPEKKGKGFESIISDPRVWGPVVAAAIALFSESKKTEMAILPGTPTVAHGANTQLTAIVRDRNGQLIIPQPTFTWVSLNSNLATVNTNGQVTGVAAGSAIITATATVAGKSVAQVVAVQVT